MYQQQRKAVHWDIHWCFFINYCFAFTYMRNMVSCYHTLQQCWYWWHLLLQFKIHATVSLIVFQSGIIGPELRPGRVSLKSDQPKIIWLFRGREIYFTLGIAIYLAWTLTLVSLTGAGIYFGNNCGISVDDDQAQNDFQVSIYRGVHIRLNNLNSAGIRICIWK